MRRLFCFPFAGAGASVYRPWIKPLADDLSVMPVQLPGREKLFTEPPFINVHVAIATLRPQLAQAVNEASEIIIFGHSLGAVLAYEFAKTVPADKPCVLIVSGSSAPACPRMQHATGLDDAQFLARVREFAGYSHPALDDPNMCELLLPTLRADVEMHEGYVPVGTERLEIPVMAIRGNKDELVTREDVTAWGLTTKSSFEYVEVEGGHMYIINTPTPLFDLFRQISNRVFTGNHYAA